MNGPTPIAAERQTTSAVLMVRPAHFAANSETADSNYFQTAARAGPDIAAAAQREFAALAAALAAAGIRVHTFDGQQGAIVPDEVFPNNWLSLHADGTAVLYPMLAENRRRERRGELLDALQDRYGYHVARVIDLTYFEKRGAFLEGTGSVVLDRVQRIAYACLSARTHPHALAEFGRRLDYEVVAFDAADRSGRAIYHTNVLMSVGATFAAVCLDAVFNAATRKRLRERLEASGKEVIDLSLAQLHAFAGNMLALDGGGGGVIALSTAALASLAEPQLSELAAHGDLVATDVSTIEKLGGGSVRCMLAEVHLPAGHSSPAVQLNPPAAGSRPRSSDS